MRPPGSSILITANESVAASSVAVAAGGAVVGAPDGTGDGDDDGETVGTGDGEREGVGSGDDGETVGTGLGEPDGTVVGAGELDGTVDGVGLGEPDGAGPDGDGDGEGVRAGGGCRSGPVRTNAINSRADGLAAMCTSKPFCFVMSRDRPDATSTARNAQRLLNARPVLYVVK